MRKTNEKNNKGFSLVELIVVIAIMIVLVAVLAPVFTKYIEQSRRATDVTNANTISQTILVGASEGEETIEKGAWKEVTTDVTEGLKSVPKVKGDEVGKPSDSKFYYYYDKDANLVHVVIATKAPTGDATGGAAAAGSCTGDLTDDEVAQDYKNSNVGGGAAAGE